jgi:flavin reductase (DIM6/NTAB) family NADH-FMN oxidoreductase RutF
VGPEEMRLVMGHFATGATIVTAAEEGRPVGFTCQSCFSLSLSPPLVALALGMTSTSWLRIAKVGTFCVNILAEDQREICEGFAVSGGDKFTTVRWAPEAGERP